MVNQSMEEDIFSNLTNTEFIFKIHKTHSNQLEKHTGNPMKKKRPLNRHS